TDRGIDADRCDGLVDYGTAPGGQVVQAVEGGNRWDGLGVVRVEPVEAEGTVQLPVGAEFGGIDDVGGSAVGAGVDIGIDGGDSGERLHVVRREEAGGGNAGVAGTGRVGILAIQFHPDHGGVFHGAGLEFD